MNWESPVHSFSYTNGEPPTPIRTPSSASFGETSFQTPKLESSFYDPRVTWNTADPYAQSPDPSRTPRFVTGITPTRHTPRLTVDTVPSIADFGRESASHVLHTSPNPGLPVPLLESSRQFSSSPNPYSAKRTCLELSRNPASSQEGNAVQSHRQTVAASMQTPPPTSTTNRKAQDFFAPNEQIAGQTMSSPNFTRKPQQEHMVFPVEASPQLFPNLQFSPPDPFQWSLSGPATAPILPQQRLLWENDTPMQSVNMNMPPPQSTNFVQGAMAMDPFTSPQPAHNMYIQQNRYVMPGQMPMSSAESHYAPIESPSIVDRAVFPTPFGRSSSLHGRAPSDDPSMFLSSPARRFGPVPDAGSSGGRAQNSLQPYFHQNEEYKREVRARSGKGSAKQASTTPTSNTAPSLRKSSPRSHDGRPGIKRSISHTGVADSSSQIKRQTQVAFSDTVEQRNILAHGRLSKPLDAQPSQLASLPPRTRTSLTFTIDPKTGLAQAIPRVISEKESDAMDLDGSSGEDSDEEFSMSRNSTFAYHGNESKSKPARLKSTSSQHSKNSSSSSTGVPLGLSIQPARPHSTPTSAAPIYTSLQSAGGFKIPVLPAGALSERETAGNGKSTPGDAQHALKQIMRERPKHGQAHSYSRHDQFTGNYSMAMGDVDSSPTTITDPDAATPSTDRGSSTGGTTRCICQSRDLDGGTMIQCESCLCWLHLRCVGIDPNNLPNVYVCTFCVSTPPRGGRIRAQHPPSPLAHKSHHWR